MNGLGVDEWFRSRTGSIPQITTETIVTYEQVRLRAAEIAEDGRIEFIGMTFLPELPQSSPSPVEAKDPPPVPGEACGSETSSEPTSADSVGGPWSTT